VNEESNDGLPAGWESASLAALCQINPPLDRCVVNDAVEVNFVPMRAVESEGAGLVRPEVRRYGDVKKGYTSFLSGDVIMAKITPCMENGKTTVVPAMPGLVCFGSTEFHVVRPETGALARWIAGYLVQHEVRRSAQRAMTGGVGQMRVPAAFLESLRIPIAPTAEQERIADALDELLSELDAGVATLERVGDKLKLYRAAVLKAAAEGVLTAEWRKRNPEAEPASELLKRILAERRRRWEEGQLQKFKGKDREPPNNWKSKYKEPVAPDLSRLPALPSGWCWTTLDALGFVTKLAGFEYTRFVRYTVDGDLPVVKAENVTKLGFKEKEFSFVHSSTVDQLTRSRLLPNDLLMVFVGVGVGQVGRVPPGRKYFLGPNVSLIRLLFDDAVPAYVESYLRSAGGLNRTLKLGKATAQGSISMEQIRTIAVPLPPLAEQESIVEAVEGQLSVIDHLESELDAKLNNTQALRQSILRHAFSGKLVPQDPKDEPASELLKRIAGEREQRAREAAAAKRLNGHKPRRLSKPRGKAARAATKETNNGRIADR